MTWAIPLDNLKAAIAKHYENTLTYPEFADVAEEEGQIEISDRLWPLPTPRYTMKIV